MNEENRIVSSPLAEFKFKGNRDYLHGTDILPAALSGLGIEYPSSVITDIDIVFRSIARTGLTLQSVAAPDTEPVVRLSCKINGVQKKFVLIENGRSIVERYHYPEEEIVAATRIDTASATATSDRLLRFTNIERWVAMVKALHQAMYPDLMMGKWLFVRGQFERYENAYDRIVEHRVAVQANFDNKLTRSALLIDGKKLGDIFFSLA